MFVNRFFINKQNGIKLNDISRSIGLIVIAISIFFVITGGTIHADKQTYTQNFQNDTTTLSGRSVKTSMYFNKMDYWDIKKATFNFDYQISQLANDTISDVTVSVNGVKFYSFRPEHRSGFQNKTIEIPLELIQGNNKIEISGQILNKKNAENYNLAQTPANWITIKSGSNVNFEYELNEAENTLHSFNDHFLGEDTIANQRSKIVTSNSADQDELTASMTALTGGSRVITTDNDQINVVKDDDSDAQKGDYIMYVAKYDHLPDKLKKEVSASDVDKHAVIKTYYTDDRYYMIVTAKTGALLKKAAKFVANAELMKETNKAVEDVDDTTDTFTSVIQDEGRYQLTNAIDTVKGAGHQETSYFVTLPNDRNNADGSKVKLKFRYSKNLNFNRSLVTVYINKIALGSKKLTAAKADGDTLTLDVPKGTSLGNSFEVRVAFDLEMKDQSTSDNERTPWAEVDTDSVMNVKSQRSNELLFTNYPTIFIKNETYNNLAVVVPKKLDADDFRSLTNIFNLIGAYAKSNTGTIQFYNKKPSDQTLSNKNVIVLGTPDNNAMIRTLNKNLYFKYNSNLSRFVSNEKLSIEKDYGKSIGTAQLIRSPYNDKAGMLVVTGPSSKASYLATTQLNFKKNIDQYSGDAIVVDEDNTHYSYRFKKNKYIDAGLEHKRMLSKNSQIIIYVGIAVLIFAVMGLGLYLILKKQAKLNGGNEYAKQR
ncbi:cellulose biosynthesis cyclic di-GMP-binding regulatory protein BcsB [Pediococcus stilesii]|uniref:cellulose biosynthesis cyclic di-GMP-binding regulatory protein BcsB n=1 Tax=Pediococcus stilesii TaxID=331679 RepID=UPI003B846EEF